MVEYGNATTFAEKKVKRNPPPIIFGIPFGEVTHLDYQPNTELKVPQRRKLDA